MSAIYIHAGAVAGGINELKSVLLQLMHPMKPGGSAGPGRGGSVEGLTPKKPFKKVVEQWFHFVIQSMGR